MSTWPNRGASGGPCGGLNEGNPKHQRAVRSRRSDSSQQASSKAGAVHIGPGHDELQRDATAVHQQVPLAALFFPDRSGCVPPPLAPRAP